MAIKRREAGGPPDFVIITMLIFIAAAICFVAYSIMEQSV
jgi:hypothetical protein